MVSMGGDEVASSFETDFIWYLWHFIWYLSRRRSRLIGWYMTYLFGIYLFGLFLWLFGIYFMGGDEVASSTDILLILWYLFIGYLWAATKSPHRPIYYLFYCDDSSLEHLILNKIWVQIPIITFFVFYFIIQPMCVFSCTSCVFRFYFTASRAFVS